MKDFNEARIIDASEAIADGLREFLRLSYKSPAENILENCGAYHAGLTNGEARLAVMRALGIAQAEAVTDFSRLIWSGPHNNEAA